jgi:hypothetical protein
MYIAKELEFIRRKWEYVNQEQLERKLKPEFDKYVHHRRFEEFSTD